MDLGIQSLNSIKKKIDPKKMPRHVAIIMDGNGRWAKEKGLSRAKGHREGIEAIQRVVKAAVDLGGVKILTLYAFSTENWNRPRSEVARIMALVKLLPSKIGLLNQHSVSLRVMGRLDELSFFVRKAIKLTVEATQNNKGMILNFAVNYGGREEIVDGVKSVMKKIDQVELPLSLEEFNKHLYWDFPDVDLLIRTSGSRRISNFMLWHIPYAEMAFVDILWPNFQEIDFYYAVHQYQKRRRRFGNL
jgi:undecaprenyl diphosphate synthase